MPSLFRSLTAATAALMVAACSRGRDVSPPASLPPPWVFATFDSSDALLAQRMRFDPVTTFAWVTAADTVVPVAAGDTNTATADIVRFLTDSVGRWTRYDTDVSSPSGEWTRHLTVLRDSGGAPTAVRLETSTHQTECRPPVRVVEVLMPLGRHRIVLDGGGDAADSACAESVAPLDASWLRVDSLSAWLLLPRNWRAVTRAESVRVVSVRG